MPRKHPLKTHFDSLSVKLAEPHDDKVPPRRGFFKTKDLDPDAVYPVLATFIHHFPDGDEIRCFVLRGPEDRIIERVVTNFSVVSMI